MRPYAWHGQSISFAQALSWDTSARNGRTRRNWSSALAASVSDGIGVEGSERPEDGARREATGSSGFGSRGWTVGRWSQTFPTHTESTVLSVAGPDGGELGAGSWGWDGKSQVGPQSPSNDDKLYPIEAGYKG